MKITKQDGPPEELLYFDDEVNMTPDQVEDVVEIFNTPLTGSYNWDYTVADNRIKKLYELGKELNWNGSIDLNWDYTHPANEKIVEPDEELPHEGLEAYENLSEEDKILFDRHTTAELMSQFLHGEQGALLVASQLACCAPTFIKKALEVSRALWSTRLPVAVPANRLTPLVGGDGRGRGDYHRPGASFHTVRDWPAGGVVRVRFHAKPADTIVLEPFGRVPGEV